MKVLVTGAGGFIGKNMLVHLQRSDGIEALPILRHCSTEELLAKIAQTDVVIHLAGENRPREEGAFIEGNVTYTEELCAALKQTGRKIPLVYASSIQALRDTPYGRSKKMAEDVAIRYAAESGSRVCIFRLPNVFGKWARPNYNSAVATFAYNLAHGLPIQIHDARAALSLVYIDDVVTRFLDVLQVGSVESGQLSVLPVYDSTVGHVADVLSAIKNSRISLTTLPVGSGLSRALHATYLSYLEPTAFSYPVTMHEDARGRFVEMLKTEDSGQFSFFTAHPGVTRGGHFHHSKTEKFLVLSGEARFGFRHILTGETYSILTRGSHSQIVETAPGWAHDVTNVGTGELVVMLWANEIFNRERPDTYAHVV